MTAIRQLPRYGSLWLLIAFVASVLPHTGHLPPWISVAAAVAVAWRVQIFRGAWHYPGRWVKFALLCLCLAGLVLVYGRLYGLEPMVAMLVAAYALKLLEMRDKRDALIVVYLGFFVAVSLCLFDQSLVTAAIVLFALAAVTAGLAGIHQTDLHHRHFRPAMTGAMLLGQALPLMLVLFLVMPRLPPLWSVPMQRESGTTGMSDTLSPGDITQLGRSAEVAFRVEFADDVPPRRRLYWRGLVLSRFDGRTWSQWESWTYARDNIHMHGEAPPHWLAGQWGTGTSVAYRVTLEPTQQHWLYSLPIPQPLTAGTGVTRNYSLVRREPVVSETAYRVRSWQARPDASDSLSPLRRRVETHLPAGYNPRTQRIARQWAAEADDTEALVRRVLDTFRRDFFYTLNPPALGQHSVDEFLWDSRRGYCEHFASAFAFFMRAAGVPARVVVGYQGGEHHRAENYLIVRQYDAHAWAEVWLEGSGWVRVDPTVAVAPERIERSVVDVLEGEEGLFSASPLSLERFRSVAWLNTLRLRLDYLDYLWTKWVLGYREQQQSLLGDLLGRVEPWRIALFLLAGAGLALLPVLAWCFVQARPAFTRVEDRWYRHFCDRLAGIGLAREPGEAPGDFARRVAVREPAIVEPVKGITEAYERCRYGGDRAAGAELKARVRRFRPRWSRLFFYKDRKP